MTIPKSELEAALDEHWDRTYRLALALVRDASSAEDAAQEAFVRFAAGRRSGGAIREPAAWLATVALNEARGLCASRSLFRQSSRTLWGRVMDDWGAPIAGAAVSMKDLDTKRGPTLFFEPVDTTVSDGSGCYVLHGLKSMSR